MNALAFRPLLLLAALLAAAGPGLARSPFDYLDESDPFYVHRGFPKLTTPQWVGESGIEAVVVLAIDDMRAPAPYEAFLRPVLERLKQIDGRAPVSIFCNALTPGDPQLHAWLREGLSLEIHTLTHPCPLLAKGNFDGALNTYHGCVELLNLVPNNRPVAFRMPCCDSMNSPSPRFYSEIFSRPNPAGQFLSIDSSVMVLLTSDDPALPRALTTHPQGGERFRKYVPFPAFTTTIDDYPYPFVIDRLCWEFPAIAPSDWEAQNLHGPNQAATLEDWKAALDAVVLKQGVFTFIFHPHGWIRPEQLVAFIDYAETRHRGKVRFLNFREAAARLDTNLLNGSPLRAPDGRDNGARLVDLDQDGFLDVVVGNDRSRVTRRWVPATRRWAESAFPVSLVDPQRKPDPRRRSVRFIRPSSQDPVALLDLRELRPSAWSFAGNAWKENPSLLAGLDADGVPLAAERDGVDTGLRFRDFDNDEVCDVIAGGPAGHGVWSWSFGDRRWRRRTFDLPAAVSVVDSAGRDAGLRFIDLNHDGFEDLVSSNTDGYSIHVYLAQAKEWLGWKQGWSFSPNSGRAGDPGAIPKIVRSGPFPNNGAWFRANHLWVQNEDTDQLPDKVDRRSFAQLFTGPESPPRSPADAQTLFQTAPGLEVTLVASEPAVQDPVAFQWGADGRLWVVEMRDYPLGIDNAGKPGGVIKVLEDAEGDGLYEKATVFMENLRFPNGIQPWRRGVLISAAPDILYAEDTDGDGRADVRKVLLTGFVEGNQQHRVNGFELGLDGWVYAANGDSGGEIRPLAGVLTATPPPGQVSPLNLRGHDLRFKPDTGEAELVAGATQFGRRRDAAGHWFGNNNPTWLWHYVTDSRYLERNPALPARAAKQILANYEDPSRTFPVSPAQPRMNWVGSLLHVTSANSPAPYTDDRLGPDFIGAVFISEPAHNLIHREQLTAEGPSFSSTRPPGEKDREFLASRDPWFRPTLIRIGPDGAVYVADMYRLVIEHPEYFPDELKRRPDLRAGDDRGRIWRIASTSMVRSSVSRLDTLPTAALVQALGDRSGWRRDTAMRLLAHQASEESALAVLRFLGATTAPIPIVQALATLEFMGRTSPAPLTAALANAAPSPAVTALILSEPFLRSAASPPPPGLAALHTAILNCARSPHPEVIHQLALTLGEWADPRAGRALAALVRPGLSPATETALLSSVPAQLGLFSETLLRSAVAPGEAPLSSRVCAGVIDLALDQRALQVLSGWSLHLLRPQPNTVDAWRLPLLGRLLSGLDARGLRLDQTLDAASLPSALQGLEAAVASVPSLLASAGLDAASKASLLALLGRSVSRHTADANTLGALLDPGVGEALAHAAVDRLARIAPDKLVAVVVEKWEHASPSRRVDMLNTILSQPAPTRGLIAALQAGAPPSAEIPAPIRQRLLDHPTVPVRTAAQKLFQAPQGERRDVVSRLAHAEKLAPDLARGAALMHQHCSVCHRLGGKGFALGPDLDTLRGKPFSTFLTAILDPSAAVDAAYQGYSVTTRSQMDYSGIIEGETATQVRLRMAGGLDVAVERAEIASMSASKKSLMPDGFETLLSAQELADLIGFLR